MPNTFIIYIERFGVLAGKVTSWNRNFPTISAKLPESVNQSNDFYTGCIKKKFTVGKSPLMQRALNV